MIAVITRILILHFFLFTYLAPAFADQKKSELSDRILNGVSAPEMISTVGVTYRARNGKESICTGVIISKGIVLTAGHCSCGIKNTYQLTFHRKIRNKIPKISGIPIKYERYKCSKVDYVQEGRDYAIIKFNPKEAKGINYKIAKITRLISAREYLVQKMTVVGYGLTELDKSGKRRIGERRKAEMPVLSWFCWEDWAISRGCGDFREFLLSDFGTTGSVADSRNRDSCFGDSGGPVFARLKLRKKEQFYLVGIVSRGMHLKQRHSNIKCGGGGIYSVVGRNSILKWLQKNGVEIILR